MTTSIDTRKIIKEQISLDHNNYYVPGYLRIKCKNFTQMDLQNLNAGMNATLIFTVYYGDLPDQIVYQLSNNIVLNFGRDNAISLTSQHDLEVSFKNKKQQYQLQFSIRQVFDLRIQSDVFYTPFQIINLILSVSVQPVKTRYGTVKINLMDHQERIMKLSYSQQGTFGNYDLAEQKMRASYTNDRVCQVKKMYYDDSLKRQQFIHKYINKIDQNSHIDNFQYAHFLIPLYKYPIVSLAIVFLPLWLLAIVNLGVFFQQPNMADRIGSISGLMVAFVALIPTIRQNIPPNPEIVFIQILVYAQSATSLLALIDSVATRNNDSYVFVWYKSGLFLASAIITVLTFIIVIILIILHYFKWLPTYNMQLNDQKDVNFKRLDWKNDNCDIYFSKIAQMRSLTKIKQLVSEMPQPKSLKLKKQPKKQQKTQ